MRIIEPESEADPFAILLQMLLAYGNVVGRTPGFLVEADYHHTNEFAVLVGVTSKGRKGTSFGQALRPFLMVDPTWTDSRVIKGGLSSGEGLIWQVRDAIYRVERDKKTKKTEEVLVDQGIDDKRLLVAEPEFANLLRVMGREGSTLSPMIRNAWDRGDRQTLTKNSPAKATGAHISLIGHITVEELRRYLSLSEAANGFGNRFLWACVKRSKLLPEGGQLSEDAFEPILERLQAAVEFGKATPELHRDDEAREIWAAVYEELSEGQPGMFGAVTSRSEAHVLRLSMLYALLDIVQPRYERSTCWLLWPSGSTRRRPLDSSSAMRWGAP